MRIVVTLSIMLVIPSLIVAEILHVPADYPTIQSAVDPATAGDVVLVAPGTFVENIHFPEKKITLLSEKGPKHTVIEIGRQEHDLVIVVAILVVLAGFVILIVVVVFMALIVVLAGFVSMIITVRQIDEVLLALQH